jgi:hypothetical protein
MFVIDAKSLLTKEGVRFSNGNMQSQQCDDGDDENFFNSIAFDDVYHSSGFSPEVKDRILHARCAEVLAPSPMGIREHLSAIVCRSPAERAYLLDIIGDELAAEFSNKIVSYTEPGIFVSKWAYVDSVEASDAGFKVRFHPRADGGLCDFRVDIFSDEIPIHTAGMAAADLTKIWIVKFPLQRGRYRCVIRIDDVLAYEATHLVDDLPF